MVLEKNRDDTVENLEDGIESKDVCEEGVVIPTCCGQQMKLGNKVGAFVIAKCHSCGDTVYIKCGSIKKPEMIND